MKLETIHSEVVPRSRCKGFSIKLIDQRDIQFEFDTKEDIGKISKFKNILATELQISKNDFDLVSQTESIREEDEFTNEESFLRIHLQSVVENLICSGILQHVVQ